MFVPAARRCFRFNHIRFAGYSAQDRARDDKYYDSGIPSVRRIIGIQADVYNC